MSDEMQRVAQDSQDSPPKKRTATDKQRAAGRSNLMKFNASRGGKPHSVHGVATLIRTGEAPTEIERKLDDFEQGLVQDLGGKPTMSEIALIQSARTCLGVCLLAHAYIQKGGLAHFTKNRWVLSVCATYSNTLRLNLQALNAKWSGDATSVVEDLAKRRQDNSLAAIIQRTEEAEEQRLRNFSFPRPPEEAEEVDPEEYGYKPKEENPL